MYPNPQAALPIPPRSRREQYEALARELTAACRSDEPDAIRAWASRWIRGLRASVASDERETTRRADELAQFASGRLRVGSAPCRLADARFVIARALGFSSWRAMCAHVRSLARAGSSVSCFERAASAIVAGDVDTVRRLVRKHPRLSRARSTREHRATLLHYVSANGVEGYRQSSPRNIASIARILLAAGADVDAEANVYGGGWTTLGLVATSAPPAIAGVQEELIDLLLAHGARMELRRPGGNTGTLVYFCLANGQPTAAQHLADRSAPLDLAAAAGLGRLEDVKRLVDGKGRNGGATDARARDGFSMACRYGRVEVVDFLLELGVDVNAELRGHGQGHTGLHTAAFHGHSEIVDRLLRRGARVDVADKTWGTPPLIWALTGWSRAPAAKTAGYYGVVSRLLAAGASVNADLLAWPRVRANRRMRTLLRGRSAAKPRA